MKGILLLVVSLVGLLCQGCAGHGASTGTESTGSLSLRIDWPTPSRVIPAGTKTIVVSFKSATVTTKDYFIQGPANGGLSTTIIPGIPPGIYDFSVSAFGVKVEKSEDLKEKVPTATIDKSVLVEAGKDTIFSATMVSTLDHFRISGLQDLNSAYSAGVPVRDGTILSLISPDAALGAELVFTPEDVNGKALLLDNLKIRGSAVSSGIGVTYVDDIKKQNNVEIGLNKRVLTVPAKTVGSVALTISYKDGLVSKRDDGSDKSIKVSLIFSSTAGTQLKVEKSKLKDIPASLSHAAARLEEDDYTVNGFPYKGLTYEAPPLAKGNDLEFSKNVVDHGSSFTPFVTVGLLEVGTTTTAGYVPILSFKGAKKAFSNGTLAFSDFSFKLDATDLSLLVEKAFDYETRPEVNLYTGTEQNHVDLEIKSVKVRVKDPFADKSITVEVPSSIVNIKPVTRGSGDTKAYLEKISGKVNAFRMVKADDDKSATSDVVRVLNVTSNVGKAKVLGTLNVVLKAPKGSGSGTIK